MLQSQVIIILAYGIFHDELLDWNSTLELILHHLVLWLKIVDGNFTYRALDFLRGS
jgi:hypothetical protein